MAFTSVADDLVSIVTTLALMTEQTDPREDPSAAARYSKCVCAQVDGGWRHAFNASSLQQKSMMRSRRYETYLHIVPLKSAHSFHLDVFIFVRFLKVAA